MTWLTFLSLVQKSPLSQTKKKLDLSRLTFAKKPSHLPRTIPLNSHQKRSSAFPANLVRNQKYNVITFLPLVLYEQFKFFYNLYFLLVALSQFVPALRIGERCT